jgi:hypothetical protein
MDWYAIQVITGKEPEIIPALHDFNVDMILPQRPMIIRREGMLKLANKPLMPGYIIAHLQAEDFYRYQRNQRVEKMMIRICGNGYDAVPLKEEELDFFRFFCGCIEPLILDGSNAFDEGYVIQNPPPWDAKAEVIKYDDHKFEASIKLRSTGFFNNHEIKIAAYHKRYSGLFSEQLKGLSDVGFGRSKATERQTIIHK